MDALPSFTLPGTMGGMTKRTRTPRLQVVKSTGDDDDDIHGGITITAREASQGAKKLISLRSGLDEKLFMVTIPPGIADGTTLRLKGMGARRDEAHRRGEVYLKIDVR